MPRLHWTGAGQQPEWLELVPPRVTVGRRAENDLVLSFGYISGHHAVFEFADGHWVLRDLNSTNGTKVNGQDARSTVLSFGDRISFGSLDLRYLDDTVEPEAAPGDATELAEERDAFATLANLGAGGGSELEKLSLLLDLQAQWGEGFTSQSTIHRILDSSLKVSGAERACLLLQRDGGFEFSAGLDVRGVVLAEDRFQASRSVLAEVLKRGQAVFMTQGLEGGLAEQKSIVAMNLRAVGCMPLRRREGSGDELIGILYLDSQATMHTLSGLDQRILLKLAGEAETVLERMELIGVREEQKQMQRELELARQTQEGLLPDHIPEFEGWYLDAFCRPTRQVGGDFYEFIPLPDGRMSTMIADVSGKGVAASLVSSSVQGALQMMLREGHTLAQSFRAVNDYLCERSEEGRFVTIFATQLGADGRVCWANAGHNPAYLYRRKDGSIEELFATGMILGSLGSAEFGVTHGERDTVLEPGDVLLIYSDGLTEATGPADELFGEERVLALLREHAPRGGAGLREKILGAVEAFTHGQEQSDDITIVVAARPG